MHRYHPRSPAALRQRAEALTDQATMLTAEGTTESRTEAARLTQEVVALRREATEMQRRGVPAGELGTGLTQQELDVQGTVAVLAERVVRHGDVPAGMPPEVERVVRALAARTEFRDSVTGSSPNRARQMELAAEAIPAIRRTRAEGESRPALDDLALGTRIHEVVDRNTTPGLTEGAVILRARQLAEAYEIGPDISIEDRNRLGLSRGDMQFLQRLGGDTETNIPNEIATRSTYQVIQRLRLRARRAEARQQAAPSPVVAADTPATAYRRQFEPLAQRSGEGLETRYTLGEGPAAIAYEEIHFRAGVELVRNAEALRAAHPNYHELPPQRRAEVLQEVLGSVPAAMRDRAGELAQDRTFIAASGETPNRRAQLGVALDQAGYIPAIASRPEVIRATAMGEAIRLSEGGASVQRLRVSARERREMAGTMTNPARASALRDSATYLDAQGLRLFEHAQAERFTITGEGSGRRYVLGSGDQAIEYIPAHVTAGNELVYHADAAIAQVLQDHPNLAQYATGRREALIRDALGHVRPEMRDSAIELAINGDFIQATTAEGGPNRAAQLELGLRRAGNLDAIANDPDVILANARAEVVSYIRDTELSPADLEQIAAGRQAQADALREGGTAYGRRAAAALEQTGEMLHAEAVRRRTVVATPEEQVGSARQAEVVAQADPATALGDSAVAQELLRRSGTTGRDVEWVVAGERIGEVSVSTRMALSQIDAYARSLVAAGQEVDIVVFTGDKHRLGQINELIGFDNGTSGLEAYRSILQQAARAAVGEGGNAFLLRPANSDEAMGILVVPRGRGQEALDALPAAIDQATTRVMTERMAPDHPESLGHLRHLMANPRDIVSASLEYGNVVRLRRSSDGSVSATYTRADGHPADATVVRPGIDGAPVSEIIGPALSRADDPSFASGPDGLRARMGVGESMDMVRGLEPVEVERVTGIYARREGTLTPADTAIVARVTELTETGMSAERAIEQVARERVNVRPDERVSGEALEIRLSVHREDVTELNILLAEIEGYVPQTHKGIAEVLANSFGIRGLNTFFGHPGTNMVITSVEAGVASFQGSEYARSRGLRVRRLGTMKYVIEGGTAADTARLHAAINAQLVGDRISFRVRGPAAAIHTADGRRITDAPPVSSTVRDITGEEALAHVMNTHLVDQVVDRRTDPAKRTDWNGNSRHYELANAIISTIALGDEVAASRIFGAEGYRQLRDSGIIDLIHGQLRIPGALGGGLYIEPGTIRHFEDLIGVLRRRISGARGREMEGIFRRLVIQDGEQIRARFDDHRVSLSDAGAQQRISAEVQRLTALDQSTGTSPERQALHSTISELVATGMSREAAITHIADSQVRPDVTTPTATRVSGDAEFSGAPRAIRDSDVVQGDGSTVRLGDVPRARILSRIDTTPESSGSSAGVFRGEVMVDGVPTEVAVKVFRDPTAHDTDAGLTTADWTRLLGIAQREVNAFRTLSEMRVTLPDGREVTLGPAVHGFVEVDGNIAVAMDRIHGRSIDEMTPSEIQAHVTPDTYDQLRVMWDAVTDSGHDIQDFQFAVLTRDQVIGGVQRQAGDVVIFDVSGFESQAQMRINSGDLLPYEGPVSADVQVNGAERMAEGIVLTEHLWTRRDGVTVPRRSPEEYAALDSVLRGVLGVPEGQTITTQELITNFLSMEVRGSRSPGLSAAERRGRVADYISSMSDRAEARRLTRVLHHIGEQSGVHIIPRRSSVIPVEQAVAVGAPRPAPRARRRAPRTVPEGPTVVPIQEASGPLSVGEVGPFTRGRYPEFEALSTTAGDGALHVEPADGTPVYHDRAHTGNVAQMTHELAIARGLSPEQAQFLSQVALIHDIDPGRAAGRPPRVPATLEWMRSETGQQMLRERFGWGDREISMAEALIQRTEFPFDGAAAGEQSLFGPRPQPQVHDGDTAVIGDVAAERVHAYYDRTEGSSVDPSPLGRYRTMLEGMSAEDRAFVLSEGAMLSEYSDKSSWYFRSPAEALRSVQGLGTEAGFDMLPGTHGFLGNIGAEGSFTHDMALAARFGIEMSAPTLETVLPHMSAEQRANWQATRRMFEEIAGGTDPQVALAHAEASLAPREPTAVPPDQMPTPRRPVEVPPEAVAEHARPTVRRPDAEVTLKQDAEIPSDAVPEHARPTRRRTTVIEPEAMRTTTDEEPITLTSADVELVEPEAAPIPLRRSTRRAPGDRREAAPVAHQDDVTAMQENLTDVARRYADPATRDTVVSEIDDMLPVVQDQMRRFIQRIEEAGSDTTAQQAIITEYAGRVRAARLAHNPDGLIQFAYHFRYGVDSAPEVRQRELNNLPPRVREQVVEFAQAISGSGWGQRHRLSPTHAERVGRALEAETVQGIYRSEQEGHVPTDPVDVATLEFVRAGGREPDVSTPEGRRIIEGAAQFRRMARRLVEQTGSTDVIAEARTYAEQVRAGRRPRQVDAGNRYEMVRELARASAEQSGSDSPTPLDYLHGALMLRQFESQATPETITIVHAREFAGETHGAIEQHIVAQVQMGEQRLEVRIFRDRVTLTNVDPQTAIGEVNWPTARMRDAFATYARSRLEPTIRSRFQREIGRIPAQEGAPAEQWTPVLQRFQGAEVMLSDGTPMRMNAPVTAEEAVRIIRTGDLGPGRRRAVQSFREMSVADRETVIRSLRERARPAEQEATRLEQEARQLERQMQSELTRLNGEAAQLEAQAEQLSTQLDPQVRQLRRRADLAEGAGNIAEAQRLRQEAGELMLQSQGLRAQARVLREQIETLRLPVSSRLLHATALRANADYYHSEARYFTELHGLRGEVGQELSRMYGVSREQLEAAYTRGEDASEARAELYNTLGIRLGELPPTSVRSRDYQSFTTLADDPFLAGMILSGDLLHQVETLVRPDIQGIAPTDRIIINQVNFQNGLVGAYRMRIQVVDAAGQVRTFTDAGGVERTNMMVFAKRQGLRPDSVGAEGTVLTGAPAPRTHVEQADGTNYSYTGALGRRVEYGIMRDLRDFHGEIAAGGERVQVTVDAADEFHRIPFDSSDPTTQARRDTLFAELATHPENFLEELGYSQTGFAAAGFYDRHELNVWTMWLRIRNQPPAEAARVAQSLESQGYRVRQNEDGSYSFFRFGAIDTDTFGSYRARVGEDGTVDISGMRDQFTQDLHRLFVHMTYAMNSAETRVATAAGREPVIRTVEEVIQQAFGADMNGPFVRGMRRWISEFAPTTEQGRMFTDAMTSLISGYDGHRSGMGNEVSGQNLGQMESQGHYTYGSPLNGENSTTIDGVDGRTTFRSRTRISSSPIISETATRTMRRALPEGQDAYLVPVDHLSFRDRRALASQMRQSGEVQDMRTPGGRRYLVVDDFGRIPEALRTSTIGVRRQGDEVRIRNVAALAAIPEGVEVHVLPLRGIPRREVARLRALEGTTDLNLGISSDSEYLVFRRAEDIPEARRAAAEPVRRQGTDIIGSEHLQARLGILNTQEAGAQRIFQHMRGMGEGEWGTLWQGVRDGLLGAEARARTDAGAGDAGFLMRRVPNPGEVDQLPPEYGGPTRAAHPEPTMEVGSADILPGSRDASPPRIEVTSGGILHETGSTPPPLPQEAVPTVPRPVRTPREATGTDTATAPLPEVLISPESIPTMPRTTRRRVEPVVPLAPDSTARVSTGTLERHVQQANLDPRRAQYLRAHQQGTELNLGTLENAQILFGDRSGARSGIVGELDQAIENGMQRLAPAGATEDTGIPVGAYFDPQSGRIIAIIEETGIVSGIPRSIRENGDLSLIEISVDRTTGRITRILERPNRLVTAGVTDTAHAPLTGLIGMQVTEPRPPRPPGGGGSRSSGSGPVSESGAPTVRIVPEARSSDVQALADSLTTGSLVADFARRIVQGDESAIAILRSEYMDPMIRGEVRGLLTDGEFVAAARAAGGSGGVSHSLDYRRYLQQHQTDLGERAQRIQRHAGTPEAEAQIMEVPIAVGAEGEIVGVVVRPDQVHEVAEITGPRAMSGDRARVQPDAVEGLVANVQRLEGRPVDVSTRGGRDIARVRELMQQGRSMEDAAGIAIGERPPANIYELSTRARSLYEIAEGLLTPEGRATAQERYRTLTQAEKEAVEYMLADGGEYLRGTREDRLLIAEQFGEHIESEISTGTRDIPSTGRLNELARLADQMVHGTNIERAQARRILNQQALSFSAGEARAYGRFYTLMRQAGSRVPTAEYVRTYQQSTRRLPPEQFRSRAEFEQYVASVESTSRDLVYVDAQGVEHNYVTVVQDSRQTFVVGDIHGEHQVFDHLVNIGVLQDHGAQLPISERYSLHPDLPQGTDVVFLGDYIDRGPSSLDVLQVVRQLQEEAGARGIRVHTLRGNHEALFLRFYELFGNGSFADVQRALTPLDGSIDEALMAARSPADMQAAVSGLERFDLSAHFTEAEAAAYARHGVDVSDTTLAEIGLELNRVGIAATVEEITTRYQAAYDQRVQSDPEFRALTESGQMDIWRFAMGEMRDSGLIGFMQDTQGAVIIDNNIYTHAGPNLAAGTPEAMSQAFGDMFSTVHNPWGSNVIVPVGLAMEVMRGAYSSGDFTTTYGSQWEPRFQSADGQLTPEAAIWMSSMAASLGLPEGTRLQLHIGHERGGAVREQMPGVYNHDSSWSRVYRRSGTETPGVMHVDPAQEAPVRIITTDGAAHQVDGEGMVLTNRIGIATDRMHRLGVLQTPETVLGIAEGTLAQVGARADIDQSGAIRTYESGGRRAHRYFINVAGAEVATYLPAELTGAALLQRLAGHGLERTPGEARSPVEFENTAGRILSNVPLEMRLESIGRSDGGTYDPMSPLSRVSRSLDTIARSEIPDAEIPRGYRAAVGRIREALQNPVFSEEARLRIVTDEASAIVARREMTLVQPPAEAAGTAVSPQDIAQTVRRYEGYILAQGRGGATVHHPEVMRMRRIIGSRRLPTDPASRRRFLEGVARQVLEEQAAQPATPRPADTTVVDPQQARVAREVVDQHTRLRQMSLLDRTGELDSISDFNREGVLRAMLGMEEGDPRIAQLAEEYAAARVEVQRLTRERTAVAELADQALEGVLSSVAAGETNPTFEWLIRDMSSRRGLGPDEMRTRLLEAYQSGGIEGFRGSLIPYRSSDVTNLLSADRQVLQILADETPASVSSEMATARGVSPEAMRETLRAAYQRDGVTGVLNEVLGTPRTEGVNFEALYAELSGAEQRAIRSSIISTLDEAQVRTLAEAANIYGAATLGRDALVQMLDLNLGNAAFRAQLFSMVPESRRQTLIPTMLLRRRARLALQHPQLVEVLLRGNLEGRIRSIPGMEDVTIRDVTHMSGSVGNYRIELSDGRRVYMKPEDHRPAQFGARRLEAQGLAPIADGMHTFRYDTGITDATGQRIFREFGFAEDIHAFGLESRTIRIRMPDDQFEQVGVRSVAMMSDEVLSADLTDPAVRTRLQRTGALEAAERFQELARTPAGREQIARAWAAYMEMSRRALVIDRAPRNTAVFLVNRTTADGGTETAIVFQPIDTDFVAGKIARGNTGELDFGQFHMDFGMATGRFINGMDTMLGDTSPGRGTIAREIVIANETIVLSNPMEVRVAMGAVEAEGGHFGYPMPMHVGSAVDYGGTVRILQRGRRFRLHEGELDALSVAVTSEAVIAEARDHIRTTGAIHDEAIRDMTIPVATPDVTVPVLSRTDYVTALAGADMSARRPVRQHFDSREAEHGIPTRVSLDNAFIVMNDGSTTAAHGITGTFREAMAAGRRVGDTIEVTGYADRTTGRIRAFGAEASVPAEVRAQSRQFRLTVDRTTGRISAAHADGPVSFHISDLVGLQVERPAVPGSPAPTAVQPTGADALVSGLTGLDVTVGETTRRPWQAVPADQRSGIMSEVLAVYEASYGRAGLRYENPRELISRMPHLLIARDAQGQIVGFATFSESPRGLRLALLGANPGSSEGRGAIRTVLQRIAEEPGYFGNVSGRPAAIALRHGATIVPIKEVGSILGGVPGLRIGVAQRRMDRVHRLIADPDFTRSPIVREAMERTGRAADQLTFDDLIAQAIHSHEIPDTSEARANCFAMVQSIIGADGQAHPTLVIKIMVGRPRPAAATATPTATARPRRQAAPPGETRVATNPTEIIGANPREFVSSLGITGITPRTLTYRGTFDVGETRVVRFQRGKGGPIYEMRVPENHATMDPAARQAYFRGELSRVIGESGE